jgi:hypothetical protein
MILVLKVLYPDKPGWKIEVGDNVCGLLKEYQSDVTLGHIGFPENWQEILLAETVPVHPGTDAYQTSPQG